MREDQRIEQIGEWKATICRPQNRQCNHHRQNLQKPRRPVMRVEAGQGEERDENEGGED